MGKRCPNGSRKHRKTGTCLKKTARKRCPNGSRKHRKTGVCIKRKRTSVSYVTAKDFSKKKSSNFMSNSL